MATAATAAARVLRLLRQVIGVVDCIFVRLWMRRNSVGGSSGWLNDNEHVLCEIKQKRGLFVNKYSGGICSDLGPMPRHNRLSWCRHFHHQTTESEKWCLEFCGWTTWRRDQTTALN